MGSSEAQQRIGQNMGEWVRENASAKHAGGGDCSPPVALTGWTHMP